MKKSFLGGVILAGLIVSGCGGVKVRKEPERIKFWLNSYVSISRPPVYVRAHLLIISPTVEESCSGIIWDWGDGSKSINASDCDGEKRISRYEQNWHRYGSVGEYTVRVKLVNGGKTLVWREKPLSIQGGW